MFALAVTAVEGIAEDYRTETHLQVGELDLTETERIFQDGAIDSILDLVNGWRPL